MGESELEASITSSEAGANLPVVFHNLRRKKAVVAHCLVSGTQITPGDERAFWDICSCVCFFLSIIGVFCFLFASKLAVMVALAQLLPLALHFNGASGQRAFFYYHHASVSSMCPKFETSQLNEGL